MESEPDMSSAATSSASSGFSDGRQDHAIESIRHALAGLRYGSVLVTVQDGVIVQIDRTEKNRLAASLNGRHSPTPRTRGGNPS